MSDPRQPPKTPSPGTPPQGDQYGPPAEDPWTFLPQTDPLDDLVDKSVCSVKSAGEPHGEMSFFEGSMKFDNMALMGPPGRLQGGLHCVARTFPILHRIETHKKKRMFPCAINVRLAKAIPLFQEVPFTATYSEGENGWWLTSRFLKTDRLDAAAWQLPNRPLLSETEIARWKAAHRQALEEKTRQEVRIMGLDYVGTSELFWGIVPAGSPHDKKSPVHRFLTREGKLSLAFLCYHLDIVGAIALAVQLQQPRFTTHVALTIAGDTIPTDETLLFIADRSSEEPDKHSKARPVTIRGEKYGTSILETLLVNESFTKVYGHGWVGSHPIDIERMMKLRDNFIAQNMAGGSEE